MGTAIGDALAQAVPGQSSKQVLARIGKFRPLRYRMWKTGLYSYNTQFSLIVGQAILQSRSTSEGFYEALCRRLKWYAFSLAPGLQFSTFLAGFKSWFRWIRVPTSAPRRTRIALPPFGVLLGVVLHNTGHRYQSWARDTATLVHDNPVVVDAAGVLATAAQVAAVTNGGKVNKTAALEMLVKSCREAELREALAKLEPMLAARISPRKVASQTGWSSELKSDAVSTTVLAIYCFLRYPTDLERAVKAALLIAGRSDALVATVGGLVGAHVGVDKLPEHLHDTLGDWPHNRQWIEGLAMRLSDWPHGVDDLLVAPAQYSYAPLQLLRNITRWPLIGFHKLLNLFV